MCHFDDGEHRFIEDSPYANISRLLTVLIAPTDTVIVGSGGALLLLLSSLNGWRTIER